MLSHGLPTSLLLSTARCKCGKKFRFVFDFAENRTHGLSNRQKVLRVPTKPGRPVYGRRMLQFLVRICFDWVLRALRPYLFVLVGIFACLCESIRTYKFGANRGLTAFSPPDTCYQKCGRVLSLLMPPDDTAMVLRFVATLSNI